MLQFPGRLLTFQGACLLVHGPDQEACDLGRPLCGPVLGLRPGYLLVTEPDYLLPAAVVDDIGQRFEAPDCYDWLETQGDRFPRSDVIGERPDGRAQSVFVKELDLVEVAVFARPLAPAAADWRQVDLALEARAVPDDRELALAPVPFPLAVLDRGVLSYRLAPRTFGAAAAAIVAHLLRTRRTDWRVTFGEVDDLMGGV